MLTEVQEPHVGRGRVLAIQKDYEKWGCFAVSAMQIPVFLRQAWQGEQSQRVDDSQQGGAEPTEEGEQGQPPGGAGSMGKGEQGQPTTDETYKQRRDKNLSPRPVVSAPSAIDWQARANDLLARSHFPSDLLQLAEVLAGENKSGKARLSRIVRELYQPLVGLQEEVTREALRYGLRAAITAGAPNCNYVKKAAAGYRANGKGGAPATNSYQDPRDEYDRAFLTSPDSDTGEVQP